eukprot:3659225-Amphidinium_carterae.2
MQRMLDDVEMKMTAYLQTKQYQLHRYYRRPSNHLQMNNRSISTSLLRRSITTAESYNTS